MDADTISNFKEAILKLLQETFDAACPFGQMTYTSVELISQAIQSDRRELGQVGRQLQTGANYIKTSTSSYGPPPSPCMECISSDALDRNRRHLFVMDPSEIGHKRKMQDSDILEFLLDTGDLYFNNVTEVDVDVVEEGGVYTISDVTAQPSTVPTNSNVPQ
uniref:Uncharacterized protein n=1 Tax=Proboscia inermis TaxID=420281 RepID=A0A7S0GBB8_9STRA|mmetsp:Transcript_21287/g.21588  ORF Transcript_21287/g.21588 Transcript_21287/m.21588 type:complete len:162 (+) Transcript_21287:2-487(+)